MRVLVTVTVVLAMGLGAGASALTASGRLTTSLYTYEGSQSDSSTTTFVRVYQAARLDVGSASIPGLTFHTYLQGTTDIAEEADSDPRLRIYRASLSYKRKHYKVQAGRQRVHAGVGFGSIDGLRLDYTLARVRMTAYGGALVPLTRSTDVNDLATAHLVGGRISTDRFFQTAVSVSFADRERDPVSYDSPGRYSGVEGERPAVKRRLLGLDVSRRFGRGHDAYGRVDYDLKDEEVRRLEFRGRLRATSDLSFQADFLQRKPSVYYNSIFSVFPSDDYREVGGRVNYRLSPDLQLNGHVAVILYDGDESERAGVTATIGQHYTIGYYRSMGYSRDHDGLVGSIYRDLGQGLTLRGELDLAAYERYDDADDRDGLLSGVVALAYRPNRSAFLELQLQGLRNPTYSSDLRLFLRGSWRFFEGDR